jgi:O-antigen ligase
VHAFAREPVQGLGSGGFRVEWLRERPVNEGVREVHSLELGIAAELGLPGVLGLLVMLGGVAVAGRRALLGGQPLAAGCCAAATVWLVHASIDWDWEIPAVTLPAILMAGALIVAAEEPERPPEGEDQLPAPVDSGLRRRISAAA